MAFIQTRYVFMAKDGMELDFASQRLKLQKHHRLSSEWVPVSIYL